MSVLLHYVKLHCIAVQYIADFAVHYIAVQHIAVKIVLIRKKIMEIVRLKLSDDTSRPTMAAVILRIGNCVLDSLTADDDSDLNQLLTVDERNDSEFSVCRPIILYNKVL